MCVANEESGHYSSHALNRKCKISTHMCVCVHTIFVCVPLRKQLCKRQRVPGREHLSRTKALCAWSCVCVCVLEEGGYFGHPSALGYFATVSSGTHTDFLTHTHQALCQASCSLAGAGNAPERVVASICSG